MKFSTTAFVALTLITAAACGQHVTHDDVETQLNEAATQKDRAFAAIFGETAEENKLLTHIAECQADWQQADDDYNEKQSELDEDDDELVDTSLTAAASELTKANARAATAHAKYDFGSAALPSAWSHYFTGIDHENNDRPAEAAASYETALNHALNAQQFFIDAWISSQWAYRNIDDVPGGAQMLIDAAQEVLDAN